MWIECNVDYNTSQRWFMRNTVRLCESYDFMICNSESNWHNVQSLSFLLIRDGIPLVLPVCVAIGRGHGSDHARDTLLHCVTKVNSWCECFATECVWTYNPDNLSAVQKCVHDHKSWFYGRQCVRRPLHAPESLWCLLINGRTAPPSWSKLK